MTASAAPISGQNFAAYGSGAAVITKALQLGTTTVTNAEAAFSGGSVNSQGLTAPVSNEFGVNVQPATPGKNALGRGTGLETGLLTSDPQQATLNQLLVSGLATATAPPPSGPVVKEIPLNLSPVAFASTLRGTAAANYDPTFCPVGRPLTFGAGYAENLQLLNTGTTVDPTAGFSGSLLGTSTTTGTQRAASQSRTVTYLVPNGDGTFGVVSETRQTVAPISLLTTAGTGLLIEVAGEFGLRVTATGKPGGATAAYTGNPVITVSTTVAGVPLPILGTPISLQSLLGMNGLSLPVPPLATVGLGTPPRALGGALNSTPALAADGTSASAAVDAVRLSVLNIPGVINGLDLALGHMEGAVTVPAGGITCDIPVSKTASIDPVTVGQDFTYQIKVPSDSALYNALFNCDLTNIVVTDTVTTESGNPTIKLISADHGGVVSGNKVTFPPFSYGLGQEPIVLTITANIPRSSGAGVLKDTVNATAVLGNCRGGANGEDIVQGNAKFTGSATSPISGTVILVAPNVTRGNLAATGGNSWPLVAGGGFLLAALGLVRLRRRATDSTVPAQG